MNPEDVEESGLDLSALETSWLGRKWRCRIRTGSTSDDLWEWVAEGAPHGAICLADSQTAGRGRQSRRWEDVPGGGLYLSVLLLPRDALRDFPAFSLVAALAAAEAVESCCRGLRVDLKWPNDLMVGGKKLAGLLLESRSRHRGAVVLGWGLNLKTPVGGWPSPLREIAVSLNELGADPSRDELLCAFLNRMEPAYELFEKRGFQPFRAAWKGRSMLEGRWIEVEEGDRRIRARVVGIHEQGQLVVEDEQGRQARLNAGEVHLSGGFR